MFKKELLNQNRVLTMSNNRKCNFLIVNCGIGSTIVMGIKDDYKYSVDIVFIKEIFTKKFDELIEEVICICNEFSIDTILTDKNGVGLKFYEKFSDALDTDDAHIESIKGINKIDCSVILYLEKDIENCKLRFMQTYKAAKISYRKVFLGYSEIMNYHKETEKLINEMDNLKINISDNGKMQATIENRDIGKSRFECLMIYYNYKRLSTNMSFTSNFKKSKIEIKDDGKTFADELVEKIKNYGGFN